MCVMQLRILWPPVFTNTTANGPANDELDFGWATCSTRGVISLHNVLVSESEWPVVG